MARLVALAVALLALLLAGCGAVSGGNGQGASVAVIAASPTPTFWSLYGPAGSQLVSVSAEDSGRVLAVAAQLPAGHDGCMRNLTAELTEYGRTVVYLTVEYQSRLGSVVGACSNRVMTVHVRLPGPLGQRDVMINTSTTFAPSHGALLRRCGEYCGPVPQPPPASCSQRSYQWAMLATAPPMNAAYQVLGCDGRWLVLDVVWPGGPSGCDAPCNPDLVKTRWFFRAGPHGWVTIISSLAGGCARVRKVEPQFPARLCVNLAAPG